jgi:AraC-like DNA-binding protein
MAHRPEKPVREVWKGSRCKIPELLTVGWDIFRHARPESLAPHTHAQAYEICYIVAGGVDWWVESEMYELNPGDVFITRPNERHGGVDAVMHPCELYWLQVLAPLTGDERELSTALANLRLRTFPGSASVPNCFQRILKEMRDPTPLSRIAVRAALDELLVEIIRGEGAAQMRKSAKLSPRITAMVKQIDLHPEENDSVTDLAATAGVGPSRFHEQFVAETGYSPAEYRTRRRVLAAKRLLRNQKSSIIDIALSLGFSSSQYFATVFHHYTGLSPRQYRRQAQIAG